MSDDEIEITGSFGPTKPGARLLVDGETFVVKEVGSGTTVTIYSYHCHRCHYRTHDPRLSHCPDCGHGPLRTEPATTLDIMEMSFDDS